MRVYLSFHCGVNPPTLDVIDLNLRNLDTFSQGKLQLFYVRGNEAFPGCSVP